MYIWIVLIWNACWVFLFFPGRWLNWQRKYISDARLIRHYFSSPSPQLKYYCISQVQRAYLSFNFADCRPNCVVPFVSVNISGKVNKTNCWDLNKQRAANLRIFKPLTVPWVKKWRHILDRGRILGHVYIIPHFSSVFALHPQIFYLKPTNYLISAETLRAADPGRITALVAAVIFSFNKALTRAFP